MLLHTGSRPGRRRGPRQAAGLARAAALPELNVRQEIVGQQPLRCPDPVMQLQFGGRDVAVVADGLVHDVPVLLFHLRAVILALGRDPET